MSKIWLFLSCLVLALSAFNSQAVNLHNEQYEVPLKNHIDFIEDRDKTLTIEKVSSWDLTWQKNKGQAFNKGFSDSAWWLKFSTQNSTSQSLQRILEINYPLLDYLDVYVVENNQVLNSFHMGDKLPYSTRPIDHRIFLIPLDWQPNQQYDVYLRVQSKSAIQVPLALWEEQAFYASDTTQSVLEGIFFGTMLAIAIYNLLIFSALKDRTYILYVGYVVSMPLFLASATGYTFRYLWPEATQWNDQSIIVFLATTLIFGIGFTRSFLKVESVSPLLDKALIAMIVGSALLGLSAFKLNYMYVVIATIVWAVFICTFCLVVGIKCWANNIVTAKYYCLAWFAMLAGGVVLALSKLSILPANHLTEYSPHFGTTLEVLLLSFALAERINSERLLRYQAQQEALISTQRTNEDLEHRVQQRTKELEKLTEQLKRLSNTDQLTGLNNRRFFDETLAEEWERNGGYNRSLALILLDIDHFKSVNDTYGHPAGDHCLKEVAQLVKQGLRWPSDIAARYGGEEFCIILPETNYEGALTVAERIRESIERHTIETKAADLNVTVSLGIHCCVPSPHSSPEQLIKRADDALYAAKQQGRNRAILANTLRPTG